MEVVTLHTLSALFPHLPTEEGRAIDGRSWVPEGLNGVLQLSELIYIVL